jgi:gamma-glutamylcyclotransferase (GGCT)/AIG2-like uncharacterized protein YtfP
MAVRTLRPAGGPEVRLATDGSLAPGRPNHAQLSDLPGRWLVGQVRGALAEKGWAAELGYPRLTLVHAEESIEVHVFESQELVRHWERLDAFEGPGHRRVTVDVTAAGGNLPASIYVVAERREEPSAPDCGLGPPATALRLAADPRPHTLPPVWRRPGQVRR